tara:strand:+ start:305 stop:523 length:219 start_codon:yes stop_codon:yes gene_type:complete
LNKGLKRFGFRKRNVVLSFSRPIKMWIGPKVLEKRSYETIQTLYYPQKRKTATFAVLKGIIRRGENSLSFYC